MFFKLYFGDSVLKWYEFEAIKVVSNSSAENQITAKVLFLPFYFLKKTFWKWVLYKIWNSVQCQFIPWSIILNQDKKKYKRIN